MQRRNFRESVSAETWYQLTALGRRRLFQPAEILMHQGGAGTSVIALSEGIVKVRQSDEQGCGLTMTLRGPGEVLGEYGVLLNRPRSATVEAVTRCLGHVVTAAVFHRFVQEHELTATVYQLAVERLEQREHLDTGLAHLRPESRLATLPVAMVGRVGRKTPEGIRVELGMSREDFGAMASMSRSLAVKLLGDLQAAGLVMPGRQHVTVTDLSGLEAVARGDAITDLDQ